MEEWKECKLGDYCDFQNGYAFKSSEFKTNGEYKIVKIKELKDGLVKFLDDSASVDIHDIKEFEKYKIYRNDVLFALTGDPVSKPNPLSWVGRVSIYRSDENALLNQRTCKIKKSERIDNKFLYYYFRQWENFYALASKATGSASQANISTNTIADTIIKLPPLPTQQKIAAILSSLDDKIELNNKINTNLEQQAQALFKNWFVDFEPFGGKIPEGWKVGKLEDIADYYNGYAFSSKELLNEPEENCLDVFKQGHIKKGGGFISDGTKSRYPLSKCEKLKNFILKKGDILMAMTDMKGNVAILGNTAIMPVDDKYIVNQRVGLLRAKENLNIDYPYLYLLTNDHDFLMDLRSRANSGVQVNLSSTAIKESEVNIAPKEVYKQFNDIILPLFEKILANQQENQKLANIRDTLLPKLMNGEIEV